MRVRKKDKKNLVKVGAFISGLTIVLMVIIASIGKETSLFSPKVSIKARVPNVSNLKTGSFVELKGIRIGTVEGINIVSEDEVEIRMTILEDALKWIKEDSKVSVSTAGLVGDKYVEIFNGTKDGGKFDPGKDVLVSESVTDFKSIVTKGENIASVTERILTKLDTILTKIGDGKMIVQSVQSINNASANLEAITGELKEANMGEMVRSVKNTTASMDKILTRIEKGPGTINSLIYDESVHDDLRALLGGAQRNKVIKYFIRESIKKSEAERKPQD